MIVNEFDVVTMPVAPNKTDSELIIHPNRVLSFAIAPKSFELIPGRGSENRQLRCCMKLKQFPQGYPLNRAKAFAVVKRKSDSVSAEPKL